MLYVVRYDTFKSVSLNTLVTSVISCPKYVNVAHLFLACSFSFRGFGSFGFLCLISVL
jgi:hypothetical protein